MKIVQYYQSTLVGHIVFRILWYSFIHQKVHYNFFLHYPYGMLSLEVTERLKQARAQVQQRSFL